MLTRCSNVLNDLPQFLLGNYMCLAATPNCSLQHKVSVTMSSWVWWLENETVRLHLQLPTFFSHGDNVNEEQLISALHRTQVNSRCPVTCTELNTVLLTVVDGTPIASPQQLSAQLADTQDTWLASLLLLVVKLGAVVPHCTL